MPLPPRPAWALTGADVDGPIVVLGAAERMETELPGTEQRSRRSLTGVAVVATSKRRRLMLNSSRRGEPLANAADEAVGDGAFSQGQQLNAIHVIQGERRDARARKRDLGSAGETLGRELRALAGCAGRRACGRARR